MMVVVVALVYLMWLMKTIVSLRCNDLNDVFSQTFFKLYQGLPNTSFLQTLAIKSTVEVVVHMKTL